MNRTTEQNEPVEIEQLYRGLDADANWPPSRAWSGSRCRPTACC